MPIVGASGGGAGPRPSAFQPPDRGTALAPVADSIPDPRSGGDQWASYQNQQSQPDDEITVPAGAMHFLEDIVIGVCTEYMTTGRRPHPTGFVKEWIRQRVTTGPPGAAAAKGGKGFPPFGGGKGMGGMLPPGGAGRGGMMMPNRDIPPVDAGTPEHIQLVSQIKARQREDPGFRDAWNDIVKQEGGGTRDPNRHSCAFLQSALARLGGGTFVPPPTPSGGADGFDGAPIGGDGMGGLAGAPIGGGAGGLAGAPIGGGGLPPSTVDS